MLVSTASPSLLNMGYDLPLDQVKELEKRGAELAAACKWNGTEILAIAMYALTDANFHAEAAKLGDMVDELEHDA